MKTPSRLLLYYCIVILSLALPAGAAETRFRLFDWSNADAKRGVYFGLENKSKHGPLSLDTARFYVAIGDGQAWRRIEPDRSFRANDSVSVRLTVTATGATLQLDGQPAGESPGAFAAASSLDALVDETERWARARVPYRVEQSDYRVTIGDKSVSGKITHTVTGQLALFEFPLPQQVRMPAIATDGMVIETQFRIVPILPSQFAGAVDRYGQAAAGQWPGKIASEADFARADADETERSKDWQRPSDWDEYGGLKSAPWHEKPTGFFRVTKHGKVWWLISPEGNPLFYTGICVAPELVWTDTPTRGREGVWQELPPKTGATAAAWENDAWLDGETDLFSPHAWNMMRRYGADWKQRAINVCSRRMDAWAFSGLGKFCDREDIPGKPRVETIKLIGIKPLVRHIDVFDPKACAELRAYLDRAVAPWRTNPRIVGFSVQNEYEGVFSAEEIRAVLKDHPDSSVAQAIAREVPLSTPATAAQIEQARQLYAKAYYAFIYRTMKEVAPHHLYLSYWIVPGWWENETDWDMAAPYCDVLGYDKYALKYGDDDGTVLRLIARHDKPTLVGEFCIPAWYGGERGFGRYSTYAETDRESGEYYASYVKAAAADPRCIGAIWFKYRDDPITGRGGDPGSAADLVRGEAYAFGLVDEADRPKWDLVTRVRETNLTVSQDRLNETK